MKKSCLVLAALIFTGVSGSVLAKNHHDEFPQVVMSTDCAAALAAFRNIFDRYYFAVSADRKICTYSYCQSGGCQRNLASWLTLGRCEKESGTKCLRYGADERVPEVEGQ